VTSPKPASTLGDETQILSHRLPLEVEPDEEVIRIERQSCMNPRTSERRNSSNDECDANHDRHEQAIHSDLPFQDRAQR
jgi:hypothetical protein